MIAIKTGTQTFSNAPNSAGIKSEKQPNTMSATDKEKYFKDKDLGAILNKVADPNWVDPTKTRKVGGNTQLDKESFMKLLLTQLKNQDPTSPMESHEMAAQLAQFTSLEKLTNINDSIGSLAKAQKPAANYEALNLIGKAVSGDSSKVHRTSLDEDHEIPFDLKDNVVSATIQIKDAGGQVLRQYDETDLKKGKNSVTWNGKLEDGTNAPKGGYRVEIVAKASNGKKIHAETKFQGTITGVNFTPQGPMMLIGKKKISLSEIKTIVDPSQVKGSNKEVSKALKAGSVDTTSDPDAANNLQSVGMSRGLINRVKNNGIKTGIN